MKFYIINSVNVKEVYFASAFTRLYVINMLLRTKWSNKWSHNINLAGHRKSASWSSWRYESLLRFGIGGLRFFPRFVDTMISKHFDKLCIIEYYRKYEVKITCILFKFIRIL